MNAPSRRAQLESSQTRAKKTARKTVAKCPICDKPVVHEYRPFCSVRCADLDLGHWFGGRYAVAGEKITANKDETDE